jgi:hypothetical protein
MKTIRKGTTFNMDYEFSVQNEVLNGITKWSEIKTSNILYILQFNNNRLNGLKITLNYK